MIEEEDPPAHKVLYNQRGMEITHRAKSKKQKKGINSFTLYSSKEKRDYPNIGDMTLYSFGRF